MEADNLNFNLAENKTGEKYDEFVIKIYERNIKSWTSQ